MENVEKSSRKKESHNSCYKNNAYKSNDQGNSQHWNLKELCNFLDLNQVQKMLLRKMLLLINLLVKCVKRWDIVYNLIVFYEIYFLVSPTQHS